MTNLRHQSGNTGGFAPSRLMAPLDSRAASPALFNRMAARWLHTPRPPAGTRDEHARMAADAGTVARRTIPRLVAAHRAGVPQGEAGTPMRVGDAAVAAFTRLVLANDTAACQARIDLLMQEGATFDQLCLGLLSQTASRLGDMWHEDECGFFDVTAGLGTLHTLLHRSAERHAPAPPRREASRRVLLATLAGEQHSFGLQMVGELFRRAGWDVAMAPGAEAAGLATLVAGSEFAVAGLSVAGTRHLRAVTLAIRGMRKASANRSIGVVVGGAALATCPDLAIQVGADVAAADATQAVSRAEGLRLLTAFAEE